MTEINMMQKGKDQICDFPKKRKPPQSGVNLRSTDQIENGDKWGCQIRKSKVWNENGDWIEKRNKVPGTAENNILGRRDLMGK